VRKLPFNNDSSPAERRRVVRETGATYHDIARGEAGTVTGRYAAQAATRVTGSEPPIRHATVGSDPPVPYAPHWLADPCGPEPPLGYSIEEHPAVGEPHEIENSLLREKIDAPGMNSAGSSVDSPGDGAPPEGPHLPSASDAPSPLQPNREGK
jgi:hypothetical protein